MDRLVGLSIRRPVLVAMVVLAVVVLGGMSLTRMGLDLLPNIEFPVVAVVTVYPGAGPAAVEQQVTGLVEGAFAGVGNVRRTTSLSLENVSLVVAELNWGADVGLAVSEVDQALARMRLSLPQGVERPAVFRMDPSQLPIAMLAVTGQHEGDEADLNALTRAATDVVAPLLERVPGVGQAVVSGGTTDEVQVRYDPARLAQFGVSATQLTQAIRMQNVEVPLGPLTEAGRRYQVRAGATVDSVEALEELPVSIQLPGRAPQDNAGDQSGLGLFGLLPRIVRVRDVADVALVHRAPEGFARVNGRPSVLISVLKESGHNTVDVARQIDRTLREHRARLEAAGVTLTPIFDQSRFIVDSLSSVTRNGALGAVLAVVILYLFLADLLSTFTIALAIPISVVATLALMYLGGITLNLMSLGGLGLGIGMLVDNSIVVLENIFRHARRLGKPPEQAAREGTGEVAMAITASTLTTVAVFVPVIFVGGMAGEIFREMALTVSFSLLASLAVAFTVVPAIAARLRWSPEGTASRQVERLAARGQDVRWFGRLQQGYRRALEWSLRHRWVTLVGTLAVVGTAAAIYPHLDVEFLAPVDTGQLGVVVEMPPGTPVEETDRVVRRVEAVVQSLPDVRLVSTQVGTAGSGNLMSVLAGESPFTGNLFVQLKPRDQRRPASEVMGALRRQLQVVEATVPGSRLRVTESPSFGALSQLLGRRVTINLDGPDLGELSRTADAVAERLRETPGFINVTTSQQNREPTLTLRVDPARALTGGMLAAQVGAGLRQAVAGEPAGDLVNPDGQRIPIVVQARAERIDSLQGLLDLPVTGFALPGASPPRVLVGRVARPVFEQLPVAIQHQDGQRIVVVTADLDGIELGEAGRRVEAVLQSTHLPAGTTASLAGIHQLMAESFGDLWLALALAAALVYMVMAAQFDSLLDPLLIMLTAPLALAGALLGLAVTGQQVGVVAIIGGIVLVGIVVNNGIVLVDYTDQLARRGMAWGEAVVEAGVVRLRPVLMTALTTILGLLPLTFGWGESSELEVPLAISVVAGLSLATFLTLFVLPAVKLAVMQARARRAAAGVVAPALTTWWWVLVALVVGVTVAAVVLAAHPMRAAAADGASDGASPLALEARALGVGVQGAGGAAQPVRGIMLGAGVRGRAVSTGPFEGSLMQGILQAATDMEGKTHLVGLGVALERRVPLAAIGLGRYAWQVQAQWSGADRFDGLVAAGGEAATGNLAAGATAWVATPAVAPGMGWLAASQGAAAAWMDQVRMAGSGGFELNGRLRTVSGPRFVYLGRVGGRWPVGGAATDDDPTAGLAVRGAVEWIPSGRLTLRAGAGPRLRPVAPHDVTFQWLAGLSAPLAGGSLSVELLWEPWQPAPHATPGEAVDRAALAGAVSYRYRPDRRSSEEWNWTVQFPGSCRPASPGTPSTGECDRLPLLGSGPAALLPPDMALSYRWGGGRPGTTPELLLGWQGARRTWSAALSWPL